MPISRTLVVASLLVAALHWQSSGWRAVAFSPSPTSPTLHRLGAASSWSKLTFRSEMPSRRRYMSPPGGESPDTTDACADGKPSEVGNLLNSASRLRREAEALEAEMKARRRTTETKSTVAADVGRREASYDSIPGSSWTISYRFSSEPPPKDDEQDFGTGETQPMQYYSGKIGVKFRSDGYTDIVDIEDVKKIAYNKLWGWDEELSAEDGLRYLLFSADVMLPDTDRNAQVEPTRFYFQTRIDKDSRTGKLSLSDGKVTVKRDIEPPGGFWGVFSGKGILAQFRVVGDFVCRAAVH